MKILKIITIAALVAAAFLIGRKFGGGSAEKHPAQAQPAAAAATEWTCSMHPQIRQPKPGKCPICAMDLIPVSAGGTADSGPLPQLKLSESAIRLAEIETAQAVRKFVPFEIRMVGKVAYNEGTMAYITARIPGRIDKLFVNYTGIAVKKGDHVAEVYSPELLVAQQEVFQSLNLAKGAAPDDEFAKRTIKSVKEKFRLWGFSDTQVDEIIRKGEVSDHLTITAQISGIVVEKNALEGKYFETGENLFAIADLNKVWINLDAYELDMPWIRYGQEVQFQIEADPGKTFTGKVAFIQPVLNEMTRTVKVRLNADNPGGALRPGMFVRAVLSAKFAGDGKIIEPSLAGKWISPMHPEIVKDAPGKCDICGMDLVSSETLGFAGAAEKAEPPLVIPDSAPLITGKRAVVYVEKERGSYEGKEVLLGPRAGNFYVVKSGLSEGDKVVVKGAFKIDSSLQILAKRSMMTMPENEDGTIVGEKHGAHRHTGELPSEEILSSYFAVQKALSRDNLGEAVKNAAAIDKRYSTSLASSKDLTAAREHFSNISSRLYEELAGAQDKIPKAIYRFRCPMAFNNKGAYWLQESEELANPYFGEAMLKCGELAEKVGKGEGKGL